MKHAGGCGSGQDRNLAPRTVYKQTDSTATRKEPQYDQSGD